MTNTRMTITTYGQVRTGTYRIDPARSIISFTLRNRLGIFPIRGTFDVREGVIEIPADPGAATVRAVVNTASFHTSIRRRDDDVRSAQIVFISRTGTGSSGCGSRTAWEPVHDTMT